MPIQKLKPMVKDFPTFDCDAHIVEPVTIWERASSYLTNEELESLKKTMWFDSENNLLIINGKADVNSFSPTPKIGPGVIDIVRLAGPGVTHDVQRALNVRNLSPETAITKEQSEYLAHKGADKPGPRLMDMDIQGIDQVMVIPTNIDAYPWLQDVRGARAACRAYNDWALEYTQENPERLFFAALVPMQNPVYAAEEIYRVANLGCKVALVRPMDAMGNYPIQPKYDQVWRALEDTGLVYGMHPFGAPGSAKPPGYSEQYSPAELVRRTISTSGLPHTFMSNVQVFQSEGALWVTDVLMSGFFERYPRIKAAVFEASSTWISFLLDECDKAFKLHRNDRMLPTLERLPSETFRRHCVTGFEGDETPPSMMPEYYRGILAWASDIYHHDGSDAWEAIEVMNALGLSVDYQSQFLGGNARKLYDIKPPKDFIRKRVTEINRPDWWPDENEIQDSLRPESSVFDR